MENPSESVPRARDSGGSREPRLAVLGMLPSVDVTTSASAKINDFGAESTRPAPLPVYASPRRSPDAGARLATDLPAAALAGLDSHQLDSIQRFHVLMTFLLCHAFVARCAGCSIARREVKAANISELGP